jgi:hypothetical protein
VVSGSSKEASTHDKEYLQALGAFVEMFAKAEEAARLALWTIAGVDPATARAIWERLQVNAAIETIKRIHVARRVQLDPLMAGALDQLSDIAIVRNAILHFGTYPDSGGNLVASEWRYFDPPEKLRSHLISRPLLNTLSQDLGVIIARLLTQFSPPADPAHAKVHAVQKQIASRPFVYRAPNKVTATSAKPTKQKKKTRDIAAD